MRMVRKLVIVVAVLAITCVPMLADAQRIMGYRPVTDQRLAEPEPANWLMTRGNYQGWSYSSLNQINRNNVQHLQLVWQWAMNDSGTNETSPIVHNGILYLVSPSHIVQALDAKTGDLIWETRAGPYQAPGGQMYNLPWTHNQYHINQYGQAVPGYNPYRVNVTPYYGR